MQEIFARLLIALERSETARTRQLAVNRNLAIFATAVTIYAFSQNRKIRALERKLSDSEKEKE